MSGVGAGGAGGFLDLVTGASGQAGGGQAQMNALLQLIARMVIAIENGGGGGGAGLYHVYDWTGGDLDIAAEYPAATAGTFSLHPAAPGPITVTLPTSNGPWIIADGSGFCDPSNQITVQSSLGVQVKNAAAYYMVQTNQADLFVLDTANYIVVGQ